jgi:DNA-binding transcriptional ArsR family regulator
MTGIRRAQPIEPASAPSARREVNDVETLRAMSDPLRLAILRLLMFDADVAVRVMSAKEIAAELGEPQTKLYRHLKQLEDAKLIEVAETRVVSGIIEQRYRTAQLDVRLSPALMGDTDVRGDLMTTVGAVIDEFRQELRRNVRANRVDMRPFSDPDSVGLILQVGYARRMNVERAREFRDRLAALIDEFEDAAEDTTGTDVHMLVGWYGVPEHGPDG